MRNKQNKYIIKINKIVFLHNQKHELHNRIGILLNNLFYCKFY